MTTALKIETGLHSNITAVQLRREYVTLRIIGAISDDMLPQTVAAIQGARQAKQPMLVVHIHSQGGDVDVGVAIAEELALCKKQGMIIVTVIESEAQSMGAFLFTCGSKGYRFMGPHAYLMIHEASWTVGGKAADTVNKAEHLRRANQMLLRRMSVNIGRPPDYLDTVLADNRNVDLYISPEEAVAHGFLQSGTHIAVPTLEVAFGPKFQLNIN